MRAQWIIFALVFLLVVAAPFVYLITVMGWNGVLAIALISCVAIPIGLAS